MGAVIEKVGGGPGEVGPVEGKILRFFPLPTLFLLCFCNFRGLPWNCGGLCAFSSLKMSSQHTFGVLWFGVKKMTREPKFVLQECWERIKKSEILDGPGQGCPGLGVWGWGVQGRKTQHTTHNKQHTTTHNPQHTTLQPTPTQKTTHSNQQPHNLTTTQLTNQPTDRPTHQATNQPTNQPANQPTTHPATQPASHPATTI